MTKSIISWVGGKAKLMWIINLLAPYRYSRCIDVFGGSGTVTLNLDCNKDTWRIYNDFNGDLVNLMECARSRPLSLIHHIGFLALNARGDFELCKRIIKHQELNEKELEEELQLTDILFAKPQADELKAILTEEHQNKTVKRAAAYYKLLRYSFNANGETYGGRKCNIRRFFDDIIKFSKSFANVTVENKDFQSLIRQYQTEDAFIYCDPPYYNAEDFYAVGFPKEDHVRLHDTLKESEGYVMVSYNNCAEVRELYQDFYIYLTTRPHSMSKKKGAEYEELIMTNYNPMVHVQNKTNQLRLVDRFFGQTQDGKYTLIHQPNQPLKC